MQHRLVINKLWFLFGSIWVVVAASYFTKRTFFSVSGPIIVDYWAFAAGVFLVGEGLWSIANSKNDVFFTQFFRLLRISVGICIFTIHFLQFVRDGKLGG